MTPDIISALSGVVTAVITLITAYIVIRQVVEMRRATHATAFKAVYDMLQSDTSRADRGFVMCELDKKPFDQWSTEERKQAERVCASYDSVGIMCRQHFIPVAVVADSWGASIRCTWSVLEPLVIHHRVKRNSKEFWDDFEWLAIQAEGFQKKFHG